MNLTGTLSLLGTDYTVIVTSFYKNSLVYILLSHLHKTDNLAPERKTGYYLRGGSVEEDYILGMVDINYSTEYGNTTIINMLLKELQTHKTTSIIAKTFEEYDGGFIYKVGENYSKYKYNLLTEVNITTPQLTINLNYNAHLKLAKRKLINLLTKPYQANSIAQTTFIDATLESLEIRGWNFDWLNGKNGWPKKEYIDIHSMDDIYRILIPDFINQHKRWMQEPDFECFLVTMDFESTGLNAYCDKCSEQDKTVYLGISFQDHKAYGIFIDMEHFDNVEVDELAKLLTNMFQIDPLEDRLVTLNTPQGLTYQYYRSQIKTCAHHMLIDIRFGLLINADIWFDWCSLQIGFNADPFFTRGNNGAKDRIEQFLGISYPELQDFAGKQHVGKFRWLSDIRVIMMYGCADVDLLRLYVKNHLIPGIRGCKDYYGIDQIDEFEKTDKLYMNFKARFDFKGVRINQEKATQTYTQVTHKLAEYYNFLCYYVARVKKFLNFYNLYISLLQANKDVSQLAIPDFDTVTPYPKDTKWSGQFLIDTLFITCQYPKLVMTKPSKKNIASGKPFVPQPAVDKDAVKYYLKFKAVKDFNSIIEAIKEPKTIEDLKLSSMYITEDVIDDLTGEVLIKKEEFNSYRYPVFYILKLLSPLEKIAQELAPLVQSKTPYRFASCSMNSAVTRRDVNPIQTTSSASRYLYIPYTDEHRNLDCDQATVEIRIAWGLTHDPKLIEPLNNPENDPHTETCAEFFNKPAYLVDKKKERKPIKFIQFGRIYGREVYSCCDQIYDGDITDEHLAETAHMIELFDTKRKPVIDMLNRIRDDMWTPREIPPFLFKFLKLKEDKIYGRMINCFNWTQHCEIREDDYAYMGMMRRKAGNFGVQGPAAHFLRKLFVRMCLAFWKKGWIQNEYVIPHLTIYDEVFLSYHVNCDPAEVALIVRDAFLVKYKDFPKFFIGINFGDSWGEGKEDKRELPTFLVEQIKEKYTKGEKFNYPDKDYSTFFLNLVNQYKVDRIKEVIFEHNNGIRNLWLIEKLSKQFQNYCVRGYLAEHNSGIFKIKDYNDAVEVLLSNLAFFLSKEVLMENEEATLICRNKKILINHNSFKIFYNSEADFINGIPSEKEQYKIQEPKKLSNSEVFVEDTLNEIDCYNFGLLEEDDDTWENVSQYEGVFIDKNSVKKFDDTSIATWDLSFMREYFVPDDHEMFNQKLKKFDLEKYIEERRDVTPKYKNFKIYNNKVTITCKSKKDIQSMTYICKKHYSTSTLAYKIYVSYNYVTLIHIGTVDEKALQLLDNFLSLEKSSVSN